MSANSKTAVEKGVYKGHPTVSIWEVDVTGNKIGKFPLISFGVNKAIALLRHSNDIKEAFNLNDGDIAQP